LNLILKDFTGIYFLSMQNVASIAAHDGLLAALAFNSTSSMLATASERGTVVRVFSIPEGDKLIEFRRGLARCASICSLSFSLDSRFLVAASNTETVHVFMLDTSSPRSNEQISCDGNISRGSESDLNSASNSAGRYAGDTVGTGGGGDFGAVDPSQAGWTGGLMSWAGGVLKAGAAYLPHQVSEVFSQDRAFAFAHIPLSTSSPLYPQPVSAHVGAGRQPVDVPDTHYVANGEGPPTGSVIGLKKVAAITCHQNQYRLLVASLDGLLHIFSVDPLHGGEAVLLKTHNLLTPSSINVQSASSTANPLSEERNRQNATADGVRPTSSQERRSFAAVCGDNAVTGQDLIAAELLDVRGKPVLDASDFPAFPEASAQSIPSKKSSRKPHY